MKNKKHWIYLSSYHKNNKLSLKNINIIKNTNRILGKTEFKINPIGLGTWQLGGKWGSNYDHKHGLKILNEAVEKGVNFIDTADVYNNGESEKTIGEFLKTYKGDLFIATKCGRQINPHVNSGYTPKALRKYVEDSLSRLSIECLDLIQLHCPPTEVYDRPEIFRLFDDLKKEGKIKNLGISVEKINEALKGIEYDNVNTIQIIFNIFRQRPSEVFFKEAANKNVGIIVRVPLASGLLTGKFNSKTKFGEGDHRNFNRNGEQFDKGETFSGIDYTLGLELSNKVKEILDVDKELPIWALKWILMHDEVSVIIPGASKTEHITQNLESLSLSDISQEKITKLKHLYDTYLKESIHNLW